MTKLRPFFIGGVLGALGLGLLPLSGLLSSSAEPSQPPVLDWYFNLAAQQSITLRSLGVDVPPLDRPGMAERGAGHYEMVCVTCHGSPVAPPEQFARNLSPQPPQLVQRMAQWHPEARIFATIKHGIRRTAMPGWPTQMRDDEVWDMVAFLLTLPELDADAYGRLTSGTADNHCARCHGENGEGAIPGIPRLDIQSPAYLEAALKAFRDGTRQSGTMMAAARVLTDAQIEELAQDYGRGTNVPAASETTAEAIVRHGLPDRDVPACDSCHDDNARLGYPRLAGQDADYLLNQLKLFKALGAERGGPNAHIMAQVVRGLDEAQMEALAEWYGR
ncbi:c-type cytochrome [Devosia ginsengisoli]|uniref:C-type cytochrome n=1 Tax=Devosia ginsengisoli TaxID=400770 RepID=A0A5B8LS15_9HYPH|nr:c-type cytochrome [Devosia ginsengisoli]QDZ10679.1 c-type cytochrome [Devosia ginsengisoli]